MCMCIYIYIYLYCVCVCMYHSIEGSRDKCSWAKIVCCFSVPSHLWFPLCRTLFFGVGTTFEGQKGDLKLAIHGYIIDVDPTFDA